MRVREERLAAVRAGRWSASRLTEANPVVLEAVDEVFGLSPDADAARQVAGRFATALGLDERTAPRISLAVASRVCHELRVASPDEVRTRLGELTTDPLVRLVCDALIGSQSAASGSDGSGHVAERTLCLVAQLVVTQEEVDALHDLVEPD